MYVRLRCPERAHAVQRPLNCQCAVQRPLKVKIKAQDVDGNKIHRTFDDPWVARVFQHEYDHLQGTLFPDRVPVAAREAVLPELRALEDAFTKLHPEEAIKRY